MGKRNSIQWERYDGHSWVGSCPEGHDLTIGKDPDQSGYSGLYSAWVEGKEIGPFNSLSEAKAGVAAAMRGLRRNPDRRTSSPHSLWIVRSWSKDGTWFTTGHIYADTPAQAKRFMRERGQGLKGSTRYEVVGGGRVFQKRRRNPDRMEVSTAQEMALGELQVGLRQEGYDTGQMYDDFEYFDDLVSVQAHLSGRISVVFSLDMGKRGSDLGAEVLYRGDDGLGREVASRSFSLPRSVNGLHYKVNSILAWVDQVYKDHSDHLAKGQRLRNPAPRRRRRRNPLTWPPTDKLKWAKGKYGLEWAKSDGAPPTAWTSRRAQFTLGKGRGKSWHLGIEAPNAGVALGSWPSKAAAKAEAQRIHEASWVDLASLHEGGKIRPGPPRRGRMSRDELARARPRRADYFVE